VSSVVNIQMLKDALYQSNKLITLLHNKISEEKSRSLNLLMKDKGVNSFTSRSATNAPKRDKSMPVQ
jgi:hypothetical protein